MNKIYIKHAVIVFVMSALPFSGILSAQTDWLSHDDQIKVRLIAGSPALKNEQGSLFAFETELGDGWKIYWRSPGQAGLPTRIFVDGNRVEELYPLPKKFTLFGIDTYGYSGQFTLPFRVRDEIFNQGEVAVAIDYMVCKDICVPHQENFTLTKSLSRSASIVEDIKLKKWLAKVPDQTGDAKAGLEIKNPVISGKIDYQRLSLDVFLPSGYEDIQILAEANGFQMADPILRPSSGKVTRRVVIPMISLDQGSDLSKEPVRITLSDGRGRAIDRILKIVKTEE